MSVLSRMEPAIGWPSGRGDVRACRGVHSPAHGAHTVSDCANALSKGQRPFAVTALLACLAPGLAPTAAHAEFPTGTVAAFNLPSCPAGWAEQTAARGRILIGTGQGTGLAARSLGETVGEETHTLTQAEMPAHSHSLSHYKYTSWAFTNLWPDAGSAVRYQFTLTGNTGGDQPHNVIMPSLVLLVCEKT